MDAASPSDRRTGLLKPFARSGLEVVLWVAAATAGVAALQHTAPAAGLGIVYLLAVLAVAVRRGQAAALITAVLSVVTLNYLFIVPRHRLAIAHSQDLIELIVLAIAAAVVARLAATGRERAAEAERRAGVASAREREAKLLADAASAVLAGNGIDTQLQKIGRQMARATGASRVRVALEPVPTPEAGEFAVRLTSRTRPGWLYFSGDLGWPRPEIERVAEPLGRLVDVAVERDRLAERTADAAAAERLEVMKTAILRAISHDLRSPLTAIVTAASALRSTTISASERADLVAVIEDEGIRLARLVDDLLDLSKIEAGALAPQRDWCDLGEVLNAAAADLRSEHPIDLALPDELPLVRADPAQLERVFSNLLENAVKFSFPDSPVRVTAGVQVDRVIVRVTDHGRAIPRDERLRIFEPFVRGQDRRSSGSGLGLAICRGFVEANGGRITLQANESETSFAVSLPLTRTPVSSAPAAP